VALKVSKGSDSRRLAVEHRRSESGMLHDALLTRVATAGIAACSFIEELEVGGEGGI